MGPESGRLESSGGKDQPPLYGGGGGGGGQGDLPLIFFLRFVSENTFQAILMPIFPYPITSISSKVRHSNTLSLTISFALPCRPLGAFVRFPCGGGRAQQLQCMSESAQCSGNSRALVRGRW